MAVVAQPWTELVGTPKPLDTSLTGLKHPRRVGSGLQCPVSHSEWTGSNGKGVAARETPSGVCTLEQIDERDRIGRKITMGRFINCECVRRDKRRGCLHST